MPRKLIYSLFIIVLAICVVVISLFNIAGNVRTVFLFCFLLFCPGMAILGLFNINDILAEWVLSVTLSLTLSMILSEGMILAHVWRPYTELGILIGVSLLGSTWQMMSVLNNYIKRQKGYVSIRQ